jgi:hypothetical protein
MHGEKNKKWPLYFKESSRNISERKFEEIEISIFFQNFANQPPE